MRKKKSQKILKLYTETGICVASLIGGPFAGIYMIAKNYYNLNQPILARKLIWISLAVIISAEVIFTYNYSGESKNMLGFNLLYATLLTGFATKWQGQIISFHKDDDGEIYSLFYGIVVVFMSIIALYISFIISSWIAKIIKNIVDSIF